jgi:hypothetical protein
MAAISAMMIMKAKMAQENSGWKTVTKGPKTDRKTDLELLLRI